MNEYAHVGDGDISVEAGSHQVLVAKEIADLAQVRPARVKPGGESPSQDVRPAVGSGNPKGACDDHKFCPYCNYVVRERAVRTFVPAFDNGAWHFLTISFTGQLAFDSANAPSSLDCWDACKDALQHLEQTGIVAGVHWTEEIAIVSFLPLRVIPHIHAVVDASTFGADALELLQQRMTAWRNAQGEGLPLGCNLHVRPVNSERSLFDRVRYMYKPIEIAPRYEAAWDVAAQNDRVRAWELNSQAREFAAGIFDIRKDRQRMNSKGTLNPRAKKFIGIKKEDRAGYSQYLQELQAQEPEYPEDPQ